MNKPAEDFGDAGVTRMFCDRAGCQNQIALNWRGRYGSYCSNDCMKLAESEGGEEMTTTETTETEVTAPAAEKPITAGASKKKAPAKKAAAKSAPAKKVAKKVAKAESNGNGAGETDKLGIFRAGSIKAAISDFLHDGKFHSVEDLHKVCDKLNAGYGQIKFAIAQIQERGGHKVEYKGDANEELRVVRKK